MPHLKPAQPSDAKLKQIVTIVGIAVVVLAFGTVILVYNFCRPPPPDKKDMFHMNIIYGPVRN